MEKLDKVIDKIKKLLALATSPNEHEASLAAQRAHELLVKYNLDMQEVKDRPPSNYGEEVVDKRTFRRTEDKFINGILERHFFVQVYSFRQRGPFYRQNRSKSSWYETHTVLVGTKANIEIASYIRAFLVDKFYQLWIDYKTRTKCAPREQQSYYAGLKAGLSDKLTVQKSKIENERGLVLKEDPELQAIIKNMGLVSGKGAKYGLYEESMDAGFEDGKKIEIRRGIDTKTGDSGRALEYKSK